MSAFKDKFNYYQHRCSQQLAKLLPPVIEKPEKLHQAMRYAVLNGGKRLRPFLVYATGEFLHQPETLLDIPAAAIEFIHCYSLVHDDLPAMDNADLRRGKPSCHKAFDDATAILVGDALQALAFESLAEADGYSNKQRIAMLQILTKACNSLGIVGGQALDLNAQQQALTKNDVLHIHQLKTGKLLTACVLMGFYACNCDDEQIKNALMIYAENIGLAFQIQDDILDIESSTKNLGKTQGMDVKNATLSYPAVTSIDEAKSMVKTLHQQAEEALQPFANSANLFLHLSEYLLTRSH